ncbi:sulfurtransferase [Jeotgalibacillus aurantiacus]|uniref:sulfurtransferase n=1 Tax=Jeotgalibacillus aurantiacus TaxID=2763266 RepID=UPI001D0AB864|nr:sulfurtransferase [Jeotgalibacillus aurantiacus]
MKMTVSSQWLIDHLDQSDIRIIDCRFSLQNPDAGYEQYTDSHIPGATYFHLNEDLSDQVQAHGGRHPLPQPEAFKSKVEAAGISNDSTVIIYDGGDGAFASRCWWLLHYFGHEKMYILNEGYEGWISRGFPVTSELSERIKGSFELDEKKDSVAHMEEVREIIRGKRTGLLVDSRSYDRYIGDQEPIDRVPGHIPGAVNREWTDSLNNGSFLTDEEQAKRFSEWEKDQPIVVYCGSGVTACPNIIALKQAGFTNVRLYPGSYSDWVSYDENEIEIGDSTHLSNS